MILRVAGSLARERRSTRAAAEVALWFAAAPSSSDVTRKRTAPPARSAGGAVATGCRDGSRMLSTGLGLPADDLRVSEAPGLRKGDHRTGERARSTLEPRPGSVQSCDGHPRPAGAGGRDGRTSGVGGGVYSRPAGPCMLVAGRRPHVAVGRHQGWCMWTDDRLNHDVAPRSVKCCKRQIAPPTLFANRTIRQTTTTRDTRQQP